MGDLAREAHLMRDDDHGHAVARERDHDVEHFLDHLRIERGGRLVEQHGDRIHGERAGDRDALLLAAGQLAGKFLRLVAQADAVEQAHAFLLRFLRAATEHLDLRQHEIAHHRQMREQLEMLEHHADARAQLRQVGLGIADRDAVDRDRALLKRLEPVDAFDQRRFARARRAAHHDDLALGDFGRAVVEDLEGSVPLAHVADGDHGGSGRVSE